MINLWREGNQVVLPRLRKDMERALLEFCELAYKTIDRFSEIKMPKVSDFRLIDRRVIDQVNLMGERHGFLRGMVAYAGFKTNTLILIGSLGLLVKQNIIRFLDL